MSDRDIKIRMATSRDSDRIVAFLQAMAVETEGKHLDVEVLRAGARDALKDLSRCAYYLAEVDGAVVGQTMVTTEWSDWRNGLWWWIQSVYVHPEYRGHGIFRALYRHVEQQARDRPDVVGLRLYVHRDNATAQQVYGRLGMQDAEYLVYECETA